ncbi:stage II sporulation protein P [Bacillus sp. AGMB 02131]|uniref:Stage II sporulation protein P n=1 Tax=Peribacillus faecalis TaxID=2772559 RepID=A0A927HCL3_9BACI|nr:stage II sporulation protein P [Peribacillus faecalis]MBD3109747.1 stage II sporulation protein P [Peribacillus faecalis]
MKKNTYYNKITIISGSQIIKVVLSVIVLLLFVFSVSGLLTSMKSDYRPSSQSVNEAASLFTGRMLFSLLGLENEYFTASLKQEEKQNTIPEQLLKYSAKISLDDPRSLLGKELPGFSIFDSEIIIAGADMNYTNMPFESAPPNDAVPTEDPDLQNVDSIEETDPGEPSQTTNGKKAVFIYHSHNTESFTPYLKDLKNINLAHHSEVNITRVGLKLGEALESKGIGATVDTTDINKILNEKGLGHSKSYQESRTVVEAAMAGNNDLSYYIDIHRDSRRKDKTTITINGQSYSKLAFVVGGKNAKYSKNLALAKELHYEIDKKYPGLSDGVIVNAGSGQNGVYNQDLSEHAMLLEVGGVDNTFEESYRTMEAFADVFSKYYWESNQAEEVDASSE